jgi:hypothetical protein
LLITTRLTLPTKRGLPNNIISDILKRYINIPCKLQALTVNLQQVFFNPTVADRQMYNSVSVTAVFDRSHQEPMIIRSLKVIRVKGVAAIDD